MRRYRNAGRVLFVSLLVFSTILTSQCFGQEARNAGALANFSVKTEKHMESIVGVFLGTEEDTIHVYDLKTFSEREIDRKSVWRQKIPISESEAALRVGVAPIIAWKMKDLIPEPNKPGAVAAVDAGVAYVTLGRGAGIRVDSELDVFRGEDVIKDPVSGEVLGKQRRKIARVRVTEVRDRLSKVKVIGEFEIKLEVGDVVESDRTSRSIAVLPGTNASGAILKSGVGLADEITAALSKFEISVVERTKFIDVLGELALQRTGVFDSKTVQNLGSQVGAFAVLSGTIIPSGRKSKVSVRLVEVETGKVLYASAIETTALSTSATDVPVGVPATPLPAGSGEGIDVLSLIKDVRTSTARGSWTFVEGILTNSSPNSFLDLPIAPESDYVLEIEFMRKQGDDALIVILPVADANAMFCFSNNYGNEHGIQYINGKSAAENAGSSSFRPGVISNGKRYRISIGVKTRKQEADLTVSLDGKRIMSWAGPSSALSSAKEWIPNDRRQIRVGICAATYSILSFRLKKN